MQLPETGKPRYGKASTVTFEIPLALPAGKASGLGHPGLEGRAEARAGSVTLGSHAHSLHWWEMHTCVKDTGNGGDNLCVAVRPRAALS